MELAGGDPSAGIDFAALLLPCLREADDHATKQAQSERRLGITHPTMIFGEGYVQSVVQSAFDDPIASLESEPAVGVQLFQGKAADEVNDFGGFFALAADSPPEPGDGLDSGKARQLRGNLPAIQHSDFTSAPVVLARQGMSSRRGPRGKSAAP